jgi:hypothetical protein
MIAERWSKSHRQMNDLGCLLSKASTEALA